MSETKKRVVTAEDIYQSESALGILRLFPALISDLSPDKQRELVEAEGPDESIFRYAISALETIPGTQKLDYISKIAKSFSDPELQDLVSNLLTGGFWARTS